MNRETVVAVLAAGFGILAVGLAAATIDERRDPDASGGFGDGGGGVPLGETAPGEVGRAIEIPYFEEILLAVAVLVTLLALVYVALNFREALGVAVVLVAIAVVGFLILQFLPWDPDPERLQMADFGNMTAGAGDSGDGGLADPEGQVRWLPIIGLLGIFGLILIAGLVLATRAGDALEREPAPAATESPDATPELAADLGAAAGRAADRMADGDTHENEVFRAWREMIALLDVADPETATPGTFARAAVEAGLAPEDVQALTRLFEEVRYGDRPATSQREDEAIDLLRRIEETYAEAE